MDPQLELLFRTDKQLYQAEQVELIYYNCGGHHTWADPRPILFVHILLKDPPQTQLEAEFVVGEYLDMELQLFVNDVLYWLADPVNRPRPAMPAVLGADSPVWARLEAEHP